MLTGAIRKEFETWFMDEYPDVSIVRSTSGGYAVDPVQWSWDTWQAATRIAVQNVLSDYRIENEKARG